MRSAPMLRCALTGTVLAVLAGPLLTTPSASASAAADPTPPPDSGKHVTLGDSFAAGPQILPMQAAQPSSCARSTKNYGSLVASAMPDSTFVDATCSGAKLTDLWAAQGEAPPQLDAVTEDTTLVTFGTLGGNDVGLVGLAMDCVLGDCAGVPGDANHQKVEATRANLTAGIEDVKAAAPNATIVMVGYGTYLPPGGCPGVPLESAEADYLQGLIDHLSNVIGEVAAAENVLFADQRDIPGRLDHTACAPFEEQWIRGVNIGDGTDGALLHPSGAGMRATAELIAGVLGLELPPVTTPGDPALARARAAMKTVRFATTCRHRSAHRAAFKVRGGKKSVTKVVFRIGTHQVRTDRTAPYVVRAKTKKLRKVRGRPKAEVTVRVDSVKLTRTFRTKRPGCLKR